MERVTGIGGSCFRSTDPDALGRWYADVLGAPMSPPTYNDPDWWQQAGPTAWGVFGADADEIGPPNRGWTIDVRARDMDAMVAQLRRAGAAVEIDPETYSDCNPVQLWEPNEIALRQPGSHGGQS